MNGPITSSVVSAMALTLVHFLRQGLAVWAVVEFLVYVFHPRRAPAR